MHTYLLERQQHRRGRGRLRRCPIRLLAEQQQAGQRVGARVPDEGAAEAEGFEAGARAGDCIHKRMV